MTTPHLTALDAADQARLEQIERAREFVAGRLVLHGVSWEAESDVRAVITTLVEALDLMKAGSAVLGRIYDDKDLELRELRDDLAAHQQLVARMEEDQKAILASSLEAHRQLTAEREKNTALNIRVNGLSRQLAEVSRRVEAALIKESIAHQLQAERFTQLTAIRDAADPGAAVPTDRGGWHEHPITEPRAAAGVR
jgi:hypothetical protein